MRLAMMAACLLLVACAKSAPPNSAQQDTLTRRQRDSVIGASRLPGSQGVRGALQAQDSAAARQARVDSIQ